MISGRCRNVCVAAVMVFLLCGLVHLGLNQPVAERIVIKPSQPLSVLTTKPSQPSSGLAMKPSQPSSGLTTKPSQPSSGLATKPSQPPSGLTTKPSQSSSDLTTKPSQTLPGLAPCGEVCSYSGTIVEEKNKIYPQLYKHIECDNIMRRMAYRNHKVIDPPLRYPPAELQPQYTMQGNMSISYMYLTPGKQFKPNSGFGASASRIRQLVHEVSNGKKANPYHCGMCVENTLKEYANEIRGKKGLVIGSNSPWLEAILLANGAGNVTTLEYAKLSFPDSRLVTYTPYTFAEMYLSKRTHQFDFGASFSSLEHSGLGRYTDPLNPYGDLEAMAQVWCMIKPGGFFHLGVPVSANGPGSIVWNAHRIYGSARLPQLTANWEVVKMVPCMDFQQVIVLRKPIN